MSKQQSRLVHAQHVFRRDANGQPATKAFPRRVWEKLPHIDQMVNGQWITHPRMGWVEVPAAAGQAPPEPLKAPEKKAAKADKSGTIVFE
jgi:hypothetical protein